MDSFAWPSIFVKYILRVLFTILSYKGIDMGEREDNKRGEWEDTKMGEWGMGV